MRLEGMRLFCTVIETGSVTQAGRRLHISQSAASQALRALEGELSHTLLFRWPGRVRPSPAGRLAYQTFRHILQAYDALEKKLNENDQTITGTVRVAATFTVGLHVLPAVVRQFTRTYPGCRVEVEYHPVAEIYQIVANGRFDLGVLPYAVPNRQLAVVPLFSDALVLITSPRHGLAEADHLAPAALQGQRMVSWSRSGLARRYADRLFTRYAVQPEVCLELENVETIKAAVMAEIGLALVPRCCVLSEQATHRLRVIPVDGEGFVFKVGAVHRRDWAPGPATQKLMEMLRQGLEVVQGDAATV